MRIVVSILIVSCITLGLSWLLAPATPAPPLPRSLIGPDATWIERAERLSQYRRVLAIVSLALTPLALWFFIRVGWSAALQGWLMTHGLTNPWLLVGAFTIIFVVGATLLSLPLDYAGLLLRRSYGLSQEPTMAWLIRQGKMLLVSLVFTLIAVQGLYWLLRITPQWWWLLAGTGFVLLMLLLTYLQPYVITPLFFTQRSLEDETLRARIFELGKRTGVPISEVYVIDASSQGNEGNAYFTGIGGATRVVLYDTLLREYPPDELLTILAHELGHWHHQHIWKGLLVTTLFAPLGLWIVHILMGRLLPAWGIQDRADIAGLPLLLLIVTLGTLMLLPIQNAISRHWEREADRFALEATNDPAAFQATFVRLAEQNLSDPTPPRIIEGLFGTHPAVGRRVAEAQSVVHP